MDEKDEIADDIIKMFGRKAGVVLITGPTAVGKAVAAYNIRDSLISKGRKACVLNMDEENPAFRNISMLLRGGSVNLTNAQMFYAGRKTKYLEMDDDTILIIESRYAFTKEVLKRLEHRKDFMIFGNTAPCMKLDGNNPYISWLSRIIRDILDRKNTMNLSMSDVIQDLIEEREDQIKSLYPQWEMADVTMELSLPHELPFLKREIWKDLPDAMGLVIKEIAHLERKPDPEEWEIEDLQVKKKVLSIMNNIYRLLEPIEEVPEDIVLPKTSILNQFIIGNDVIAMAVEVPPKNSPRDLSGLQ